MKVKSLWCMSLFSWFQITYFLLHNLAVHLGLQASLFAGKTERASDSILYERYLDVASILQVALVLLRLH